jgi:hypothetical protein
MMNNESQNNMSAEQVKIAKTTYDVISREIMESGTVHFQIRKGAGQVKGLFFNPTVDQWTLWSKQPGTVGVGMPKVVQPELIEATGDNAQNFSA